MCSMSSRLVPLIVRSRQHAEILKNNEKMLAPSFNVTFQYIDDVLSLANSKFVDRIYPTNLKIKDATDTARPATYIEVHTINDSEGRLRKKIYDKRDDFKFPISNFPFLCVNIPAAHVLVYRVPISPFDMIYQSM